MSIAPVNLPAVSGPLPAAELREVAAGVTFLQVLEEEVLREAVPTSLPPPTFPLPLPGQLPPGCPWMPLPLILVSPREERTARKRPPARGDKRSGRR